MKDMPEISVVMLGLFRQFDTVVFSTAQDVFNAIRPPVACFWSFETYLRVQDGKMVSNGCSSTWDYIGIVATDRKIFEHAALVADALSMVLVIPPKRM
jgi:hypothetical protein